MAQKPILATSADLEASLLAGAAVLVMPTGVVLPFAGNSSPSGWLACDGSAISRTTYASLFAAISTAFGVGDGSTTFNLPDFRGRFPRFNDAMFGGAAASRDTGRVHGSAQTQATAKNGLTATVSGSNSASSISASSGGMSANATHSHSIAAHSVAIAGVQGGGGGTGISTLTGSSIGGTNTDHTHAISGTAAAQAWSGTATVGAGDVETRPINLSINAIIKI